MKEQINAIREALDMMIDIVKDPSEYDDALYSWIQNELTQLYLEGRIPHIIPLLVGVARRVGTLKVSTLEHEGVVYMHRITLWENSKFGFRFHWIKSSDPDKYLHDHPFDFVRTVLSGGYWEKYLDEHGAHAVRFIAKGTVDAVQAELLHTITEVEPDTITFVVTKPARRDWGFQVDDEWIHWRMYHMLLAHGELTR